MPRRTRQPEIDEFARSSWDAGRPPPPEGYHYDWDGNLRDSYWWLAYYKPRSNWRLKPPIWPLARKVRQMYQDGLITAVVAGEMLGVCTTTAHKFVIGHTYWWL